MVVGRLPFLNIRRDTGTRWWGRRGIGDAKAMCLSDGAMERSDLLEAPNMTLAIDNNHLRGRSVLTWTNRSSPPRPPDPPRRTSD
jgi:hypothetical protein